MNVVVVGGGQVGSHIAHLLLGNGCHVRLIERRENLLDPLRHEVPEEILVIGDGADPNVLEEADIQKADVLAAVTGADEVNLVTSTIAKFEFGVSRVIARVNNPKNDWLYDASMGVDVKVSQANLVAKLIVDEIDIKNMITLLKLDEGNHSIIQLCVDRDSAADGKQIKDIAFPSDTVLIAIHRNHQILVPSGDTRIEAKDYVLAFSEDKNQKALGELFDHKP